ncbi:hypothetical protein BT69DRAFT_183441 [Atractiella rhizophila]|nr:hypothetical protein BT69DRAFT_183441 [Atractiella rhizophila]
MRRVVTSCRCLILIGLFVVFFAPEIGTISEQKFEHHQVLLFVEDLRYLCHLCRLFLLTLMT